MAWPAFGLVSANCIMSLNFIWLLGVLSLTFLLWWLTVLWWTQVLSALFKYRVETLKGKRFLAWWWGGKNPRNPSWNCTAGYQSCRSATELQSWACRLSPLPALNAVDCLRNHAWKQGLLKKKRYPEVAFLSVGLSRKKDLRPGTVSQGDQSVLLRENSS